MRAFAGYSSHDAWGTDHFGFVYHGDLRAYCEELRGRGAADELHDGRLQLGPEGATDLRFEVDTQGVVFVRLIDAALHQPDGLLRIKITDGVAPLVGKKPALGLHKGG